MVGILKSTFVDMVIKSRDEETLLKEMEETFRTLVKAQMMLKLAK